MKPEDVDKLLDDVLHTALFGTPDAPRDLPWTYLGRQRNDWSWNHDEQVTMAMSLRRAERMLHTLAHVVTEQRALIARLRQYVHEAEGEQFDREMGDGPYAGELDA